MTKVNKIRKVLFEATNTDICWCVVLNKRGGPFKRETSCLSYKAPPPHSSFSSPHLIIAVIHSNVKVCMKVCMSLTHMLAFSLSQFSYSSRHDFTFSGFFFVTSFYSKLNSHIFNNR